MEAEIQVTADVPTKIEITFPVYRLHPPEDMGGGTVGTLKHLASPYPVRQSWRYIWRRMSEEGFGWADDPSQGTNWMGLFRSGDHLSRAQTVPGGLLDASGKFIPILDYDGPLKPRRGILHWFADFAIIAGHRYTHRYTFGTPEQLELDAFKARLIKAMYQAKGFPRPAAKIKAATSFLEVMEVEFGKNYARHYCKTLSFENWKRP